MRNRRIDERALFRVGSFLAQHKLKLVCAESMTAGFLSSTFALEVSSGDYYLGSLVCYDDLMKEMLLHVSPSLIETYTSESAEVTLAMLQGLENLVPQADIYISITGLAFDSPNPKQSRPVGRVYYAFAYQGNHHVVEKEFKGNAGQIIIATCNSIFCDLYDWLQSINSNS
jgi:nicotinamide-nucleotide amidase